jgi:hypothetical protein
MFGKKYSHTYLRTLCVHAQFLEKLTFSMGCAKKEKKKLHEKAYFSVVFFLFLHRLHKKLVFTETTL